MFTDGGGSPPLGRNAYLFFEDRSLDPRCCREKGIGFLSRGMKENHEGSTSEGRPFVRTFDQRRTAALAMARELSDSANLLVATSAELCNQSAELRTTAAETRGRQIRHRVLLRRRPGAEDSAWFTVCGVVDGAPRTARFWP